MSFTNKCKMCGRCCKVLCFRDRIIISWHTKTLMLSGKCKFLDGSNKCTIYADRPSICREWECGVYE